MSLSLTTRPATTRKPTGRRRRMLLRSLPMLAWLIAEIIVVVAHPALGQGRWLLVHLLLLGAASNAIVVWSTYFADAVLRVPGGHAVRDALVLAAVNVGAVGVVIGLLGHPARGAGRDLSWLLVVGAVIFGAGAVGHAVGLLAQLRASLAGRFAVAVRYYVTAALALPIGAWLGVLMAAEPPNHARLLLAHLSMNLLGWVGLTVAGTLITLWPTILRTKADPAAVPVGRRAWWFLTIAVVALGAAGFAGARWPAVLALLVYALGLAVLAGPLLRVTLVRRPETFAAGSVLAGFLWWLGCLIAAALALAMAADFATGVAAVRTLVAPFAVGFVAQTVVGALSYLLPVIVGGGPAVVRRSNARVDRGAVPRLALANLAGVLFLLPVPSLVKVTLSLAVFVSLTWTLGLLVAAVVAGLRDLRRGSGGEPAAQADGDARYRRTSGELAAVVGVVALLVVAAAAIDPVAVVGRYVPAGTPGSAAAPATAGVAATGRTTTVQVRAEGMRFIPAEVEVPAGDRLVIELTNTDPGQVHDLVLANGVASGRLAPGGSATIDAGVIGQATDGWCSIAGHRQMGMVFAIKVIGGDAHAGHAAAPAAGPDAVGDPQGSPGPEFRRYDPVLPPVGEARVHPYTFTVQEKVTEVAPGVQQALWTFNGTAPGPTLRGRIGDVFEITFVNDGTIGHGIDFHAGALAPDRPMRVIAPGERLTYRFTATRAGIWLYHCSAMPMSTHIANGMFGAVIIDPPDLPPVDHEYVMIQSEQYWGPQGAAGNPDKVAARRPDAVVFNGYPRQYAVEPIEARVGERVRLWVLAAGPNESLAFHVVGGQFDSVWREGTWVLRCGSPPGVAPSGSCGTPGPGGSQTLDLMASQGGFVELVMPEAGHYSMVNHQMVLAERGALGTIRVTP